ncbi:hypothetical protein EOD42_14105 [Rhodovarius crocodyli]|uniref:DUF3168 domain-containing protein n=1 Tax=Rhodovarius crocodyli TaxID=1979269 RepID=A0A437MF00_9PROT|nr:phage tail terminator-like protein [Rhodovarius crocodyli]RVT96241.1 hypothetical protein EOD42_14105 [Rhodovarius crocodyli]
MSDTLLRIQRAFENRVKLLANEPLVQWEGMAFEPRTGKPWISTRMTGRDVSPMGSFQVTPHLWRGSYTILVKHPADEGLRPAYSRALAIRDFFPRGSPDIADGPVKITITNVGLPPDFVTAGWRTQPVAISWFYEEPPQ